MTGPHAEAHRAALAGLSGLPGIGPRRLRALLGSHPPDQVWADLVAGRLALDAALVAACRPTDAAGLVGRWSELARAVDLGALAEQHRAAGVAILCPGDPSWPAVLVEDPDPPSVLFALGDPAVVGRAPSVAIVGTRTASGYGIEVARRLGHTLAAAGVTVVSGLAAGIDGAGHHGALDAHDAFAGRERWGAAAPIAVVGSGLDVVYPRGHRRLWARVAAAGTVLSESPLGTQPARWRFPARNRIIAALADAVVVVESAAAGGAMLTADEAVRRDRPVLAVPGPVTSRTSRGTNRLLGDGATPACDADDVLVAIGLGGTGARPPAAAPTPPPGEAGAVLEALGWQPATLDQLVLRTGLGLEAVARAVTGLEVDGWLVADGGWFERRR